jgi:hypothetical protein
MAYTLDEVNDYQGTTGLVMVLILIVCIVSFIAKPNLISITLIVVVIGISVLVMGNLGEWEDFINTYSE